MSPNLIKVFSILFLQGLGSLSLSGSAHDFFSDLTEGKDGTYRSSWFGRFEGSHFPWLNHETLGWLYAASTGQGYWFWSERLGWLWTEASRYPQFYCLKIRDSIIASRHETEPQIFVFPARAWFPLDDTFDWLQVTSLRAVRFAEIQLFRTLSEISLPGRYPHGVSSNGKWDVSGPENWISGFLPGQLWLMGLITGDAWWWDNAVERTLPIRNQQFNTSTHDLWFMAGIPFHWAYEITGNFRYRDVLVTSAQSLSTRFNPFGGTLDSWDWGHWAQKYETIVDNMMNLELLFRAANYPGGDPDWFSMAVSHADKTMDAFICENGSTSHIIEFSALTGEPINRIRDCTLFPNDHIFARGQAWAIYGYAMSYRESGLLRYATAVKDLTGFFLATANPDGIPFWSLTQPNRGDNIFLDSSASSIAAAGLFIFAESGPDEFTRAWAWDHAVSLLETLLSPDYLGDGIGHGLLYHASNDIPSTRTDTALSYGDYYLLEAIWRYLRGSGYLPGQE